MATRVTQAAWDAKRAVAKAKAREALLGEAPEPDEIVEAEGYSEWSKDELVEELKSRDLAHSGTKDELIARLEEDDAAEAAE